MGKRRKPSRQQPPPGAARAAGARRADADAAGLHRALAVLPALLAVAVYLGHLGHPFVYDDAATVVGNPSLQEPRYWSFLLGFNRFRPLVNLSYAADVARAGFTPAAFHGTNLLLHALAAALLYLLARGLAVDARARRDDAAAAAGPTAGERARAATLTGLVAATLFALHPLQTEAVVYASARPEPLCAVFALLTLLLARQALRAVRPAGWWAAAAVAWVLAMASKENGAMVPFVLLAMDRLLQPPGEARTRRLWRLHLPLLLVVLVAGGVRVASFLRLEAGALPRSVDEHFLSQLPILWRYLRLLLWPAGQSLVHPAQRVTAAAPVVWLALLGIVALAGLLWWQRRRLPLAALGFAWLGLFLAPSSSLVPLNELMAEHRVYLAAAGLFLAAGDLVARLDRRWRSSARRPAGLVPAATAVALLFLAAATAERLRVWADPITLWRDAITKAPLTWAPHYALADLVRERHGCASAIGLYQRAIELLPEDTLARVNLGVCLAEIGRNDEAAQVLRAAVAIDPTSADAHANLGRLAQLAGRNQQAAEHFALALRHDPRHVAARFNLAMLHERRGDRGEALRLCRELVAIAPSLQLARDCVQRLEAVPSAP